MNSGLPTTRPEMFCFIMTPKALILHSLYLGDTGQTTPKAGGRVSQEEEEA